jgi:hypothetical protein
MNIFWTFQKFFSRLLFKIINSKFKFSARTTNSNNILCVYKTNELLANFNYKILAGNEFRRILKVNDPVLNPRTGIIWINDKLLLESTLWNYEDVFKFEPKPIFPKKIDDTFYSLPDNGFFHFLIEDLPRYLQAKKYGDKHKTLIGNGSKYINEVMSLLSPNCVELYEYPVKLKSLYISEKIKGTLFSPYDLNILHDSFDEFRKFNQNLKIFISRKENKGPKFKSRGLLKKNEIESIVKDLGFYLVYLEDLSLTQQIDLCSKASMIAGFHGAGLSNIVWANSGTKVIEITGTRVTSHFEHLSKICGHDFHRFSIESELLNLRKFLS